MARIKISKNLQGKKFGSCVEITNRMYNNFSVQKQHSIHIRSYTYYNDNNWINITLNSMNVSVSLKMVEDNAEGNIYFFLFIYLYENNLLPKPCTVISNLSNIIRNIRKDKKNGK